MHPETEEPYASQGGPAGPAAFQSTHWTVVLEAARQDSPSGQAALAVLYQTYRHPVYAFIRRSGQPVDEAADLTQDFFARLLERNWLASITREGGRFRSVLLTAVKHFLANERDHARTQRRGGGQPLLSIDDESPEIRYQAEPVMTLPEQQHDQRREQGFGEDRSCGGNARALRCLRQMEGWHPPKVQGQSIAQARKRRIICGGPAPTGAHLTRHGSIA